MKSPSRAGPHRQAFHRGLVGLAGVSVACAVLASVTVLFGSASHMPWLADTPSNVAAMQRCDRVQGTAARRACVETVVASVLARDATPRLARASPEVRAAVPAR
jgi:hypothetical protein